MVTSINEPIRVAAVFSGGTIRPVWFDLRGRQVWIREVAFSWRTSEGRVGLLHFSVTDGQGLYEIRFNTECLKWDLANTIEA